jgi:hypothetical protein
MTIDLEQAIDTFRRRATRYAKNERYYRGDHDLAFATEKFANAFGSLFREFALNLCPAVCDAVKDKLKITGFGVQSEGILPPRPRNAATPPNQGGELSSLRSDIDRIWDANRMSIRAGEVHKEALRNGDAYVIVWPDASGQAALYPNKASSCAVFYDEETPGKIAWAAKYWSTSEKRVRVNLFYPDRIERYISRQETEAFLYDVKDLVPLSGSEFKVQGSMPDEERHGTLNFEPGTVPNPYGVVPVFHFANNSDIGMPGVSELEAAIPVQDGLNKSVLDMLVAMEYSAYRQRWVAGIELEIDKATGEAIAPFKAGIDHLWISENPDSTFGDFNTTDLEQFLKVKDSFRIDMASVTGTPLHYLQPQTNSVPSGESLRRAETRFVAKVRDRQAAFGQVWADAMAFALRIEGIDDARLITQWEDPASYSTREILENILLKKRIGLTVEQALVEAGYGEEDVKQMMNGEL